MLRSPDPESPPPTSLPLGACLLTSGPPGAAYKAGGPGSHHRALPRSRPPRQGLRGRGSGCPAWGSALPGSAEGKGSQCREECGDAVRTAGVAVTYVAVIDRSPGKARGPWGPRWAGRTLRGGRESLVSQHWPATLSRTADVGRSSSENHGEVRKHQMDNASSLLCGRGFPEDRAAPFPFPDRSPAQILPRETCGWRLGRTRPRTRLVLLLTASWVKVGSVRSPARRKRTNGRFRQCQKSRSENSGSLTKGLA